MHKRLQNFLQNPSTMARAGYWAMLPKACIGLLMGMVFSILVGKNFCLGFLYLSYPIIAIIVDMVLYRFRNKIWNPLPPSTLLPREWNINTLELVQYAKELPKICLLRLRFIPVLTLSFCLLFFLIGDGKIETELFTMGMLWSNAHMCFFVSVLFEPGLFKKRGLKKPTLIQVQSTDTNHHRIILDHTAHSCIIHPYRYHSKSVPTISHVHDWPSVNTVDQHNPYIPGTMAWMAAQHQEAAHRSSMMNFDRMYSVVHASNPANIWHSSIHDDYHRTTHFTSPCVDPFSGINNSYTTTGFDSHASTLNNYNHSNSFTQNTIDYSSSSASNSYTQTNSPHTNPFNSSGFGF